MPANTPNNKGKQKKDWKPPQGYKSALGRARDAARALEAKTKGSVASMVAQEDVDTASEDDGEYSQVGRSLRIAALRPGLPPVVHENRLVSLNDDQQEFDPETIASINQWAHRVNTVSNSSKKTKRLKKMPISTTQNTTSHRPLGDMPAPGAGCDTPQTEKYSDDVVVITNASDCDKYSHRIASALPTDRKGLAKAAKRINSLDITCGPNEFLAMVDTGSFTHAVDADEALPHHEILPVPKSEHKVAETACGGTLAMLGKVMTTGTIGGVQVGVTWSHMKVKCPILSVRCLVDDGHDVWIRKGGGVIRHVASGEEIQFFEHAGVYYLKMKIDPPNTKSDEPLFSRLG